MRLLVVEFGSSHCSGFLWQRSRWMFWQAPCLPCRAKVARDRFHLLIWCFMLLKVCNSAHWIEQFHSGGELFYPAEHFLATYSAIASYAQDLAAWVVEEKLFCQTRVVRNKVRSAFRGIFWDIQEVFRVLLFFGSGQQWNQEGDH